MTPTMREIKQAVAEAYGVALPDLAGPCRLSYFVRARAVAYRLCRMAGVYSLTQIGSAFGNRDHTTVLQGMHRPLSETDLERMHAIAARLFEPIMFRSRRGQQ